MVRGHGYCVAALVALLVAGAATARAGAAASTVATTTTYTYNADGAPTAVTTQVGTQPATTVYLTWDNFTPDAGAPATGTVSAADGNLLGVGTSPGGPARFSYDVRDRLIGCGAAGEAAVSYAYHPASLMASATVASGDALQFYYDNTATPLMINTVQPHTGVAAGFLGPVRYLSDGTEQVLLKPRKDVGGVYDATAQTLTPYAYDPYGAPSSGMDQRQDLARNPFRYAGEYQDAVCDAYYLRARWYLPVHHTFLSRDPIDPIHRYGYTGGNPVGRTDPSGLRFTGAEFSRDVGKAVHKLAPGFLGYVEPVLPVWGQVLGGIELLGLLPSFWHRPTTGGDVTFGFLALSMVSEAGAEWHGVDRLLGPGNAFGVRLGTDVAVGASQTAGEADRRGRLDVPALVQGIETTAANVFWVRLAGGVGYHPYNMTADDVADSLAAEFHQPGRDNRRVTLVYRVREPLAGGRAMHTSPLLEWMHAGWYHESVFAVSRDWAVLNEAVDESDQVDTMQERLPWRTVRSRLQELDDGGAHASQYAFAGVVERTSATTRILQSSPLGYPLRSSLPSIAEEQSSDDPVRTFARTSQRHAAAVRRGLGLR